MPTMSARSCRPPVSPARHARIRYRSIQIGSVPATAMVRTTVPAESRTVRYGRSTPDARMDTMRLPPRGPVGVTVACRVVRDPTYDTGSWPHAEQILQRVRIRTIAHDDQKRISRLGGRDRTGLGTRSGWGVRAPLVRTDGAGLRTSGIVAPRSAGCPRC